MAEFCKCGSLMVNGRCTNKGCTSRKQDLAAHNKEAAVKKAGSGEKTPLKNARTRRASKCITYNMYETNNNKSEDKS